jgi:hypothetical protein
MDSALSLSLPLGQIVAVNLNLRDPKLAHLLGDLTERQALGKQRAEIENRTYHMGAEPTPGLDYDDRLTARLPYSATTLYGYLKAKRGGIQHTKLGKKYHVTEWAVRAFEGRPATAQAA